MRYFFSNFIYFLKITDFSNFMKFRKLLKITEYKKRYKHKILCKFSQNVVVMIEIRKEVVENHEPNIQEHGTADIDSITESIIEEDLKNFEIIENDSNDAESEETDKNTDEISEETAKIKDLLESIILVMLFVMAMRHKNIENKQKVVMDFVKERKDIINRICVCMEKTIAKNAELYKKIQKTNDISFIIQLVILALEFEGVLNEMDKNGDDKYNGQSKKTEKIKNKENKSEKEIEANNTKLTGTYAEAW